MIEWLTTARPSNQKQTAAEEAEGRRVGRQPPPPEVLQPTLDPALPRYEAGGSALSASLTIAVSDTLPPLAKMWIEGFKDRHPSVSIAVSPTYDGNFAAKELVAGTVDAALISRALKPDEITDFHTKFGYQPLSVPIAGGSYRHFGFADAIGFFVHKDNPLEKISYDELDAIYSSTRHRGRAAISTWGQLGLTGAWVDKPIHVYGIKPWDGGEDVIRQRVLSYDGKRGEWRDDIQFDTAFLIAGRGAQDR